MKLIKLKDDELNTREETIAFFIFLFLNTSFVVLILFICGKNIEETKTSQVGIVESIEQRTFAFDYLHVLKNLPEFKYEDKEEENFIFASDEENEIYIDGKEEVKLTSYTINLDKIDIENEEDFKSLFIWVDNIGDDLLKETISDLLKEIKLGSFSNKKEINLDNYYLSCKYFKNLNTLEFSISLK